MILPIVAYGAAILRKVSEPIKADHAELSTLISDMWETMYESNGVGLAAPQINKNLRLFVVDSAQIFANAEPEDEKFPDAPGIKKVFINAQVIETTGTEWVYNEGCLSIPKIREDVMRPQTVTLSFMDENFKEHTETYTGMTARVILHEYDHIEGKLFIDYIKPLRRKMLQGKLNDIHKGKVRVDYKMIQLK
jgi:peptide deformylase